MYCLLGVEVDPLSLSSIRRSQLDMEHFEGSVSIDGKEAGE